MRVFWTPLRMLFTGALAALLATAATAQTADRPLEYTMKPGDTLIALANKYMLRPEDYRTVQLLNKVADPRYIPTGTVLLVPENILKTEPVAGEISSFRGAVTLDGEAASLGAQVRQGMRVETGENAFVTIKLPDESTISLPSQSRIMVTKLRRILLTAGIDRTFRLQAGRSRVTVTPFKDRGSNFRVTTPLSVSAVRGTDFRVALDETEQRAITEVVEGNVGVAPDEVKDETGVPQGYGVVGTPAGIGEPIALLPKPRLKTVNRVGADGVTLELLPVEGAKSYRFQLATDAGFRDVFADKVSDKTSVTFEAVGSIGFFVRLIAISPDGMEGLPGNFSLGARATP